MTTSFDQPPAWVADAVFYQIFPDRFASSDRLPKPRNFEPWDEYPTFHGYKGGDLYGVLEHLDWLTDLGVNAIYFNPIFQSASNHRYHTHDFFKIDPLLGGEEAFDELLRACHSRGIRVVLDGVFNHASRGFFSSTICSRADRTLPGSTGGTSTGSRSRPTTTRNRPPTAPGGAPCPPEVQYREPGGARVLDAGGRVLD